MKNNKFIHKIHIVLILSLLISSLLSAYFVEKFDKYEVTTDLIEAHSMIKSDIQSYWVNAEIFKNDLNSKKGLFSSGSEMWRTFLHSKIIGFYYYITNKEMFDKWQVKNYNPLSFNEDKIKVSNGNKFLFLFLQSLIYYSILFFLYKKILNYYPENNCLLIIVFLALEPCLLTFHSSFFSESIFYSMQLILVYLLIEDSNRLLKNFIIGVWLGLMFMQKSFMIYFIIPLIFFKIYTNRKRSVIPVLSMISGYFIMLAIIGYANYQRVGQFYIEPGISKYGLYHYAVDEIESNSNDIPINQINKKRVRLKNKWVQENNINIDTEKDRLRLYEYFHNYSKSIIKKYPLSSIKYHLKKSLQTGILNPTYIFHFYKNEFRKKPYYFSKKNFKKKWITINIIYSLLIYIFVIIGFFYTLRNKKNFNFTIIITLFSIYLIFVGGWVGVSRVWNSSLIFLSFLFGNGLISCWKYIKKT